MHNATQQIMDEEDFTNAKIFTSMGLSKNAGIVTVAMLQTKEQVSQIDISRIAGIPQSVISICLKELIILKWVTADTIERKEGKGRPLNLYKIVSLDVITKNISDKITADFKTAKDNITKIKELYK